VEGGDLELGQLHSSHVHQVLGLPNVMRVACARVLSLHVFEFAHELLSFVLQDA